MHTSHAPAGGSRHCPSGSSRTVAPLAARLSTLGFVLAIAAVAAAAQATTLPAEPTPQVVTGGRGEVRVTPDRATLSVAVESRRPTAVLASQDNARSLRAVFDTLKSIGITAEQLTTSDFSVAPDLRWNQQKQQQELIGYLVRNTVRVHVKQLDQLGKVLDAAIAKGSNLVSSLELYASNTESARREALAKAVEQSRLDADVMAKAAGGSVSGLLEISTVESDPASVQPVRMELRASGMAAAETPIGAGSSALVVRVIARWKFASERR